MKFDSTEEWKSKIKRVLISEEEIRKELKKAGALIDSFYDGSPILLVSILKGAFVFMADLCREVTVPCEIAFMAAKSYFEGTESSGHVEITMDLKHDISKYHVIIVEDIIDSGLTMQYLRQLFGARNPASITTISFLDKASRHPESYKTDMCGFEIPDEFVVGYGLDYANYYRNLPYIGILKPECYK